MINGDIDTDLIDRKSCILHKKKNYNALVYEKDILNEDRKNSFLFLSFFRAFLFSIFHLFLSYSIRLNYFFPSSFLYFYKE